MIISASRRTDLPARYSEWLVNRFSEGYVYVRNPVSTHQVSKVSISPDVVDGVVFWTKNPEPMLDKLDVFKDYAYYFQITANAYGVDIEPNIPSKNDVIVPSIQRLSDIIGPRRVIWRYDPIVLNADHPKEYHYKYFEKMAKMLSGYVRRCTFSFVDLYKNTERNTRSLGIQRITEEDMLEIGQRFSEIAQAYGLQLNTCAEAINLARFGIEHACCIDRAIFEEISGFHIKAVKDPNQRPECGCIASIDIGMYNTCTNGCKYCYANSNASTARKKSEQHDPKAPLLIGTISPDDKLTDRKMKSMKQGQLSLLEIGGTHEGF